MLVASGPSFSVMNIFTRELETQQYKPALVLIETLLTELRRLDDKMILTEVHLLESRVYRGIGNLAKSKVHASHTTCSHARIPKQSLFSPRYPPPALLRTQSTAHPNSK